MDKLFNRLLIVDGSYFLHRSLKVKEIYDLRNSLGEGTGAIFSVLRMLNKELKICGDYYPVVCFDEGLAPRRVAVDPHYKHADERAEKHKQVLVPDNPEDEYLLQYRRQRNTLIEVLTRFGIPCLKYVPWEGDDLMYILTRVSSESLVLTDDKDLLQLLSNTTCVRRPMRDEMWTMDELLDAKKMSSIYDFTMTKAIVGDGSDNIPSCCKGVGEGTAHGLLRIINEFYRVSHNKDSVLTWEADWSEYPKSEDALKSLCSKLDISPRKAYLNFDPKRFEINMELVDLERVEIEDRILSSMITTLSTCRDSVDYFDVVRLLSRLEIREFPVDEFMSAVSNRVDNLLLK